QRPSRRPPVQPRARAVPHPRAPGDPCRRRARRLPRTPAATARTRTAQCPGGAAGGVPAELSGPIPRKRCDAGRGVDTVAPTHEPTSRPQRTRGDAMTVGSVTTTPGTGSVADRFLRVRGLTDLLASRLSP